MWQARKSWEKTDSTMVKRDFVEFSASRSVEEIKMFEEKGPICWVFMCMSSLLKLTNIFVFSIENQ